MVAPSRTPLRVDRLRALNAPRRVEVELDGRGAPAAIVLNQPGDGGRCPSPPPAPDGEKTGNGRGWKTMEGNEKRWRVEAVGEVWRVDDEWWRQPINRQYFEVVLEGGKHTVVFQDLANGHWFIQNI